MSTIHFKCHECDASIDCALWQLVPMGWRALRGGPAVGTFYLCPVCQMTPQELEDTRLHRESEKGARTWGT